MILLVGGAGYIGSHTALLLKERGIPFVVYDNLSRGHAESAVDWEVVEGDLGDRARVLDVLRRYKIEGVMHFAAYCLVGESVDHPGMYYENNLSKPIVLLDAMVEAGVDRFIFSSTCAVYGEPDAEFIHEELPHRPINPYGETKRAFEAALDWYGRAHGLRSVRLRYFNAAGADPEARLGESHDPETHLIPLVLQAAKGERPSIKVFGTDYPTPDGTCVRDYIHILDLAQAHLLAYRHLEGGGETKVFNLGYGRGYSVREIIDTCKAVTGVEFPVEDSERRPGDPPRLVADNRKILSAFPDLAFQYDDLHRIVETAWNWERNRPY